MIARSRIIPALLLALLPACYRFTVLRPGGLRPATAQLPPDLRDEVWNRAIGILLDEGFVPELLNESACFIRAKQRSDLVADQTALQTAVLTIGRSGLVRVDVWGAGDYSLIGGDRDLAEDLAREQDHLLHRFIGLPDGAALPGSTAPTAAPGAPK
jgi:hypothetical protein